MANNDDSDKYNSFSDEEDYVEKVVEISTKFASGH
jgi:hypothetical protein